MPSALYLILVLFQRDYSFICSECRNNVLKYMHMYKLYTNMDVCISCIIICNYKLILVISYYFRTVLDKYYTNLCENILRKNETLKHKKIAWIVNLS